MKMSVALHRFDQDGNQRLQPFATDAIRSLPDNNQRFTNGIVIKSAVRSWLGPSFLGPVPQQTHDVLAVKPTHRNKLVENARLFGSLASCVTLRNRLHQLIP